jgi:hypothetical protein
LAAADRAGEFPDYMLEFVDSLRTRREASDFLTARTFERPVLSPKPVPKLRRARQPDADCLFSSDFHC